MWKTDSGGEYNTQTKENNTSVTCMCMCKCMCKCKCREERTQNTKKHKNMVGLKDNKCVLLKYKDIGRVASLTQYQGQV